jgi:hypothetical protein
MPPASASFWHAAGTGTVRPPNADAPHCLAGLRFRVRRRPLLFAAAVGHRYSVGYSLGLLRRSHQSAQKATSVAQLAGVSAGPLVLRGLSPHERAIPVPYALAQCGPSTLELSDLSAPGGIFLQARVLSLKPALHSGIVVVVCVAGQTWRLLGGLPTLFRIGLRMSISSGASTPPRLPRRRRILASGCWV